MKRYEFTGETKKVGLFGIITVKRIRATETFGIVKIGDLGGWIEKEGNLSCENDAWVYGNAQVYGDAKVYGNAKIYGNAKVYGNAKIYGNAQVYGDAEVCGHADVCGNAEVYGDAEICGNAQVRGDAEVCGHADVCGHAEVYDDAEFCGNAQVRGDAKIYGNAQVYDDAQVRGDAEVCGHADVCGNAEILQARHLLVIGPAGSRNSFTTFFRNKDNGITVKCGCFLGRINKFIEKVQETHGENRYALVYQAAVEVAKIHIDLSGQEAAGIEGSEEH